MDEYDGEDGELILDVTGGDLNLLVVTAIALRGLQTVLSLSLMSAKLHFHHPVSADVESR